VVDFDGRLGHGCGNGHQFGCGGHGDRADHQGSSEDDASHQVRPVAPPVGLLAFPSFLGTQPISGQLVWTASFEVGWLVR
jgi:hypothetical protein